MNDSELEAKKRSAIVQCERNTVFNIWEIGRHLSELSEAGCNLQAFIERGEHSFSYLQGLGFKRLFEDKSNLAGEVWKEIGIGKTLELIRPLKEETGEFLMSHPINELKSLKREEIREEVQNFLGEKKHLSKSKIYFRDAENAFFDLVGVFGGAISGKYREDYLSWDGRVRVLRLLEKLKKVLEGL